MGDVGNFASATKHHYFKHSVSAGAVSELVFDIASGMAEATCS